MADSTLHTGRARQQELQALSPFELKDVLVDLAGEHQGSAAGTLLNAGLGNPNWIATDPREAFFLLGQFAVLMCRQSRDEGILAGMPRRNRVAAALGRFLDQHRGEPGEAFLRVAVLHGARELRFDPDAFVHELVDGVIGDNYPKPQRMLPHAERIVREYLAQELCGGDPPRGEFQLFAVEGGTAAMCYVFDSLLQNGLLARGDTIAVLQPVFTPYLEIAGLDRFNFEVVPVQACATRADGIHTWHYPEAELARLADPRIRLLVCVNPSNPPSLALSPMERAAIARTVREVNPDLVIVSDDVYATFVTGFRSLMADLPANVIGVYSFSKNFGCTGWRLGVIALHEDNALDRRIALHGPEWKERLARRYGPLALHPERIRFIDRMVADSRSVALNHGAGLSTPQQVQMALFALAHLIDASHGYKEATRQMLLRRRDLLWQGLGLPLPPEDPARAWYYVELDLEVWARRIHGDAFFEYLRANHEPVDFVLRLAERSLVIVLDGGSFGGPPWSVRVSLANLEDAEYAAIGEHMRAAASEYVEAWRKATS